MNEETKIIIAKSLAAAAGGIAAYVVFVGGKAIVNALRKPKAVE